MRKLVPVLAGVWLAAFAGCFWWNHDDGDDPEVCGDGRCTALELDSGFCPQDCSQACTTGDREFTESSCGDTTCCHGMACELIYRPANPAYSCQPRAGDLCYNLVDPPATLPGQGGSGIYCCNTLGGTSGTGNLTSLCAGKPRTGDCPVAERPNCCDRDEDCPLGETCSALATPGDCVCTTAKECARVCLVAGESRAGSSLPCCDGLASDPTLDLCGLPAGEECYRDLDCASLDCAEGLGGICD